MEIINVNASKEYEVVIGSGNLSSLGERCVSLFGKSRAVIVTDSNVAPLWLAKTKESLENSGINTVDFIFSAGEESKNAATLFELVEFMAENKLQIKTNVGDQVIARVNNLCDAGFNMPKDYNYVNAIKMSIDRKSVV